MSLYALPGPLFPPLEYPGCAKKDSAATESRSQFGCFSSSTSCTSPTRVIFDNSAALKDLQLKRAPPKHVTVKFNFEGTKNTSRDKEEELCCQDKERLISVQDVKIDAERLMKSLVSAKRPNTSTATQQQYSQQSDYICIPHEEAVEFVLSISFNGRKYAATRSMQRIFQLRKCLESEIQYHRQWLTQKQRRRRKEQTRDSGKLITRTEKGGEEHDNVSQTVQIPLLPTLDACTSSDGSFIRGFASLQNLLKSYRPAMERWLRNVMEIVPHDSAVLTNFLWEPLAGCIQKTASTMSDRSRSVIPSKLSSIEESDHETNEGGIFFDSISNGDLPDDETAATVSSSDEDLISVY